MEQSKVLPPIRPQIWGMDEAFVAEIGFLAAVAVWGATYVVSKNTLNVVGPFTFNTLRMVMGAITLALMAGRQWKQVNWSYVWPSLVTGGILFAAYGAQATGQQFTTATKAAFLTATYLVYVPILSALVLRRKPDRIAVMGVALAFFGLVLLSLEGGLRELSLASGDFWVAGAGVLWAFYFIVMVHFAPHLNILIFSSLHVLVAGFLSGVSWLFFEPIPTPAVWTSPVLLVGVVTTGFLVIGLVTSVHTWVSRLASPTRVALIAALEPVFAAGAGYAVGETITVQIIVGGLLIMSGMLLSEFGYLWRRIR
jgi:drug/metabolite transporter (DMT)-like permease